MIDLFKVYFRIIVQKKILLFLSSAVLIMIMSFSIQTIQKPSRPKVIIYGGDTVQTNEIIKKYLILNNDVIVSNDDSEYKKCMIENECNIGIKVFKNIDTSFKPSNISDYYRAEILNNDNNSIPVLYDLDTLSSDLNLLVKTSSSNIELIKKIEQYENKIAENFNSQVSSNVSYTPAIISSFNFILVIIILVILNVFAKHKADKINNRIILGKISENEYILNMIYVSNTFFLLSLTLLILYAKIIFKLDTREFNLNTNIIISEFLFFNSILMSFIYLYKKTTKFESFSAIIAITLIPLFMLGGYFWPISIMPETLQKISYCLPTSWSNMYVQNQTKEIFLIMELVLVLLLVVLNLNFFKNKKKHLIN
jgi:hypothetical protein